MLLRAKKGKHNNKEKTRHKGKNGFSIIESILCLSFFLLIILGSLECLSFSRNIFCKLKNQEEARQSALAALDKIKIDLLSGGSGLFDPIHLGLIEGISEKENTLIISSKEKDLFPLHDIPAGQTRILLKSTYRLKKGRMICIFDSFKGEAKLISSVNKKYIFLSSPLNFSYQKEKIQLFLLKTISFYLDKNKMTIRRRVNSSSPQPLVEDVALFDFNYGNTTNLVKLRLAFKSKKEKFYEISVFPKNTALATAH